MNQEKEIVESKFICPFTGKGLIELSQDEIKQINCRIDDGSLFFYCGVPVERRLEKAFISGNRSYIYPVFDDIIFLKKRTAIVARNRTKEPNKRVENDFIEVFNEEFGLNVNRDERQDTLIEDRAPIDFAELEDLGKLIPRTGKSFVSFATHDIDLMHNLVFGTNFDHYLHFDYEIQRLKQVVGRLKSDTLYVLADMDSLPLKTGVVDAMFSFDMINDHDKSFQQKAYTELKRSMNDKGASIVFYDVTKPLHVKLYQKIDTAKQIGVRLITPWKKTLVADIYFYPTGSSSTSNHESFIGKTSLGRQFS